MHVRVFAACAIAIAMVVPAHAGGIGIVAVTAPGPTSDAERAQVATAIAGAIQAGPAPAERVVLDGVGDARAELSAGAVPIATLERFRRVHEQIDEGWRAFVRVQVEFAASRLAAARTEAEAIVALPGGDALYADASLRLGAVLGHLGRADESHAAIALALALDPERPITLAEFSPDIVAAIDAVRAQTYPTRTVRITTEPAGAAVAIDGKSVGAAPLSVELTLGQHVIVARQPLYEPRAFAAAVTAESPDVSLELHRDIAWSRLVDGAQLGLVDASAQELTDATVRYADLDDVVLAASTVRRGGPALLVQRCAGLPARCTAVVEVGYGDRSGLAAAAREAWQTVRAADLRYPPSVLADTRASGDRHEDSRCELCRSPILWGSIGAAAVIGTIVVIAVVSGSRPPPVVGVDRGEF